MKPLHFATLLLGSLGALVASSCQKHDPSPEERRNWCGTPTSPGVEVVYNQTQCADPWGQAQGPQQLRTVATAYLVQQGIASARLQAAAVNPASACNACTCPTGVVLTGTVSSADLPAVLALGFVQP